MEITSLQNPKVKYVRSLQRRKIRHRERRFIVEGVRLVEEALRAGVLPALVFYTAELEPEPRGGALIRRLREEGCPCLRVTRTVMRTMADTVTPQGILAVVDMPELPLPQAPHLVLVVDGLRDPGNLGTLLRTADAAGVELVLCAPGTVDIYHPKVVRGGMGAHFRVPVQAASWADIQEWAAGRPVWLADVRGKRPYYEVDWTEPGMLIVGGEAAGGSDKAQALATDTVSIPMPGGAESLNAAIAAAVILFEAVRQRSIQPANAHS